MDPDFWRDRWRNNEIGFHQELINPWLAYYYGELGPPAGRRSQIRVFVPLCGKSKDMLWLAQNGYGVVGVEISDIAVRDFFAESGLAPNIEVAAGHTHYRSDNIHIIQGDYFACEAGHLGKVTDVFDRAALIALPRQMRTAYAGKLAALLQAGTRVLLVTLTYPEHEMDGPPFTVTEQEVEDLFGGSFRIDKLAMKNKLDDEPRFRERGLTSLTETAYKLTRL